jgi:hypothetical protein
METVTDELRRNVLTAISGMHAVTSRDSCHPFIKDNPTPINP